MRDWLTVWGSYMVGIGIERAWPGGPIPFWVWIIAGMGVYIAAVRYA